MRERVSLDGDWTLQEALGHRDIPAKVPGSVLTDLLQAGWIADPFQRENEYAALRLFDRDYGYEKYFDVPQTMYAHRRIDLVFEGLDTIAEVTLNGHAVLCADNMHRTWRVDVKPLLVPNGNHLHILFKSPNQYIAQASRENPDITYDGTGYTMGSNFLRKAHYMFGWDWGPQLPDAGVWRPCYLEGYNRLRLNAVEVLQRHENGQVHLSVRAQAEGNGFAAFRVTVTMPDGAQETYRADGDTVELDIAQPCLWQPNGWGEQPLYTLVMDCLDEHGHELDSATRRVGLRTITISQDADEWGNEFCLQVNGNKLFAMGADYIPEDSLLGRTNPQRTRKLLEDCVKANFNTIRVWGGGYYPEDWFFDICDELGLIVWLDLMYACNIYKLTDAFEQNIVAETRDNLLRVGHHACIGLICGNNEMESGWCDWPGVRDHSPALKADYIKQFEYVLKKECQQYAPQMPYWPSSPSSGGSFDDPNSYDRGDVHCWDVWHGLKPFEAYREKYPRFCSEFGFESFPSIKTVKAYTEPEDRNIFSRVMESHQKCVGANGKILYYLSQNYQYPASFEQVLYASQLLQAEAMRAGVEHWRRYRGRCMGAIYWQLNDCWPVASWASIDSFGRWKQLHYAARKFFAPLLVSCERKGLSVRINVANDQLTPFRGKLESRLIDPQGTVLGTETVEVEIPALTAAWVSTGTAQVHSSALHPEDQLAMILRLWDENDHCVSENCELFTAPKHFAFAPPDIQWKAAQVGEDCQLELTCAAFAWGVWLDLQEADCLFSDNSFFMLPGETKTVTAYQVNLDILKAQLTVRSVQAMAIETGRNS